MNRGCFSKLFVFCAAVAIIAAATADPVVEFASNAGWFGRGAFTDRSNADVVPALAVGAILLVLYLLGKAQAILDGRALPRRIWTLLPAIFASQVAALFAMETAEQLIVGGRVIGPTIWLGAPIAASLPIHGAFCVLVTWLLARSARGLAVTTLRILRAIRAIATFGVAGPRIVSPRSNDWAPRKDERVLCRIGERAPPLMVA